MAYEGLEELEIYQVAGRVCDRFYELVCGWSAFDKETVEVQLVRAADSIGANIAESYGRFHYGERLNFLYYARGSAYETKFWVGRTQRRNLLPTDTCLKALLVLDEFTIELNAYITEKRKRRQDTESSRSRRLSEMLAVYKVNQQQEPGDDFF